MITTETPYATYGNSGFSEAVNDSFLISTEESLELFLDTISAVNLFTRRIVDPPKSKVKSDKIEITIISFGNLPYTVKKPIPIIIEYQDEVEFIAISPETSIAISGSSATEALQLIKIELVELYELYIAEPILGAELRRRLKVLEGYIGKKGRQQASAQ